MKYFFLLVLVAGNVDAFEALPKTADIPKDNPQTEQKIELGKKLFFDPRLSINGTVSCNSCHNVMSGGDDDRSFSAGFEGKLGGRSSPTVWNSAFHSVQFWDGRAATLEDQAKGPLINPVEMGNKDHNQVMNRLKNITQYVEDFKKVFGKETKGETFTIDNLAKAIASFERTLIAPSAFDRYMKGNKKALSAQAIKGMKLVEEVGCTACHSGANFNGPKLPVGEGFYQKFPTFAGTEYEKKYKLSEDLGRFEVTKSDDDKNVWRVPTWRNVALTAPYFHNGSVSTLSEAVKVMGKTQLNIDLTDEQTEAIVAFLESLNGEFPKIVAPRLPEVNGKTVIN